MRKFSFTSERDAPRANSTQAGHAGQDVFSRQIAVPPLPSKARYTGSTAPGEAPSSHVPPVDDAALAGLDYSDRQRLLKERTEAAGIDRSQQKVCYNRLASWCLQMHELKAMKQG